MPAEREIGLGDRLSDVVAVLRRWWVGTGPYILVALIAFIGLGFRLWHLDTEPLHVDELLQAEQVRDTAWGDLVGLAYRFDAAPLDHIIGKVLVTFLPATDFVQRLPAVIAGAASVGLIGLLLVRTGMRLAGILAAMFTAIHPWVIEISQFARPYILPVFLVLLTLAAYQHWTLGSRGSWTVGWFALAAALALLSRHEMPLLAFLIFGGLAAGQALRAHGLRLRPMISSDPLPLGVLPLVVVTVWIPNLLAMRTNSGSLFVDCWQCDKWDRLSNGVERFGEFGEAVMLPLSLNLLLFLAVVVLVFPSVRSALGRTAWLWAPILLTAPAFALVHALALEPDRWFAQRYLVFLAPGLFMYFGVVIESHLTVTRRAGRARAWVASLTVGLVLGWTAVGLVDEALARASSSFRADWRSTADYIESIDAGEDVIVLIDTRPFQREFRFGFDIARSRYYDGPARDVDPSDVIEDPTTAAAAGRYHFVLFVPKTVPDPTYPSGWTTARFTQMQVITTADLHDDAARVDAWWALTQQLRPDVAVRSQIAGASLQAATGLDLYPWVDVALDQATEIGERAYAEELVASAVG